MHVTDVAGAGRQHDKPVKPQGHTAGLWHMFKRGEKILINGVFDAIKAFLQGLVSLKAPSLFNGVGELVKAIGQLHPAGIHLKAQGKAWVILAGARQCGLANGIAMQEGEPADAKLGLDMRGEDGGEDVPTSWRRAAD